MANVIEGKRCYLSGAIEFGDEDTNWRTEPKKILIEKYKIDLFDPFSDPKQQWVPKLNAARAAKDYETMEKIATKFVNKDLSMVDRSDFLIAYLPKGVPTTGTTHEIIQSYSGIKNPTLLVCPEGKVHNPLWFFGFIPHRYMFSSWDDLYSYLDEVNDGKHKDDSRWHFVYGLL